MPSTLETQSLTGEPKISPLAGKPAPKELLVDVARLEKEYYERRPDLDNPTQLVSFGTSGHRGSPLRGTFNEAHIFAITQAICEYRAGAGIAGPLFLARDTHALSEPAWATALEVFAANDVTVLVDSHDRYTPTPSLSHAVLRQFGQIGTGGWTRVAHAVHP